MSCPYRNCVITGPPSKTSFTFETICLQLDYCNNWKALGLNIKIPDQTLQQIATSTSCAKAVLEIIENRKPHVTVKEMRDALKEMLREDVCNVLDKYLPGRFRITFRQQTNSHFQL